MKEKINILCIETSGLNCSVVISENEEILIEKSQNTGSFSHAENLHLFIQEIIKKSGLSFEKIDAVSVSQGPGSYTGLRIGVSSAKGLCYAWEKPMIALPTLDILAQQVDISKGYIIPMLDARRMEVYSAVFDAQHKEVSPTQSLILDVDSYSEYLTDSEVVFLGDGSSKFSEIINHSNAHFLENKFPEARDMAKMSYQKFLNEDFVNLAYFEPDYLKPFNTGK